VSERCSGCGKTIFWAVSVNGSRMPIDDDPSPHGNVLVTVSRSNPDDKKCVVLAHGAPPPPGRNLYTSHFSTCPKAGQFRKKGR
jgi:hypothetical protein